MLKKSLILLSVVAVLSIAAVIGGNSARDASSGDASVQGYQSRSTMQASSGSAARRDENLKGSGSSSVELPAGSSDRAGESTIGGTTLPLRGTKVIKTATIDIRVPKGRFQSRFDDVSVLAEELGGFVTDSSVQDSSDRAAAGRITIRIPSDEEPPQPGSGGERLQDFRDSTPP